MWSFNANAFLQANSILADAPGKGCRTEDMIDSAHQIWLMDGERWWLDKAFEKHPDLQVQQKYLSCPFILLHLCSTSEYFQLCCIVTIKLTYLNMSLSFQASGKAIWADGRRWSKRYNRLFRGRAPSKKPRLFPQGSSPSSGWLGQPYTQRHLSCNNVFSL